MRIAFDVPASTSPLALDQFIAWGRALESGQAVNTTQSFAQTDEMTQQDLAIEAGATGEHPDTMDVPPLPGAAGGLTNGSGQPAEAEPRRRGRVSNAEKARRLAEAAALTQTVDTAREAVGLTYPPGAPVPVHTAPLAAPQPNTAPTAYAPPPVSAATPAPAPAAPQYTPPAVPQPQASNGSGEVSVDDLRQAITEFNATRPGLWAQIAKAKSWADGSPKGSWFTLEAIPSDLRGRLLDELMNAAV